MTSKRAKQQAEATRRRNEKQAKHEAMLAEHNARREAIKLFEVQFDAWVDSGLVGPEPIHPDRVAVAA